MLDFALGQRIGDRERDDATRDLLRNRQCAGDAGLLEERLLGEMRNEIAAGANPAGAEFFDDFADAAAVAFGNEDRDELMRRAQAGHFLEDEFGHQNAIALEQRLAMARDSLVFARAS